MYKLWKTILFLAHHQLTINRNLQIKLYHMLHHAIYTLSRRTISTIDISYTNHCACVCIKCRNQLKIRNQWIEKMKWSMHSLVIISPVQKIFIKCIRLLTLQKYYFMLFCVCHMGVILCEENEMWHHDNV